MGGAQFPESGMKQLRTFALLGFAALTSACVSNDGVASRNAPLETGFANSGAFLARDYEVRDVRVTVPETLRVSEANTYFPFADIVWRGDAYGNRYEQVEAMFEEAAARGAEHLEGTVPVFVDIELTRFHGVTEKTRFSIGGDYDIDYVLTVRNAETGEVIEPARKVGYELDAPGGAQALELEHSGQTEKVRVIDFMTQKFMQDLAPQALGA